MRKSPTFSQRSCELCGSAYNPRCASQRFCDSCSRIREVERKREFYKRTHPDAVPKSRCTDPCCICGGKFSSHFDGKPYCNTHYQRMRLYGKPDLNPHCVTNTYRLESDCAVVTTKSGRTFTIDVADIPLVQKHSWCFSKTGYLVANISGKVVKLHRYLLDAPAGSVVDHINGDPADNRRCNLRICSACGNARNSVCQHPPRSGHQGIRITPTGKYVARICVDYKTLHIGTYETLDEALEARQKAEIAYYGEFAPTSSRS